jgi:hypothetical protein
LVGVVNDAGLGQALVGRGREVATIVEFLEDVGKGVGGSCLRSVCTRTLGARLSVWGRVLLSPTF